MQAQLRTNPTPISREIRLAPAQRCRIETAIEALIALLDASAPDPDLEPDEDLEDGNDREQDEGESGIGDRDALGIIEMERMDAFHFTGHGKRLAHAMLREKVYSHG